MIPEPFAIRISSSNHGKMKDLFDARPIISVGGKEFALTECNVGGREAVVFAQEFIRMERPWSGEGFPPPGTVCELRNVAAHTEWSQATIVFASRNVIVWDLAGEPAINGLCTSYAHAVEMRPVRTPEQIAADETERSCKIEIQNRIWSACGKIDSAAPSISQVAGIAEALYDAGYRKQETE